MKRRTLLQSMLFLGSSSSLGGQILPPLHDRVEELTAGTTSAVILNHLGFLPAMKKRVLYRPTGATVPLFGELYDLQGQNLPLYDLQGQDFPILKIPLARMGSLDLGNFYMGDFSQIKKEGMYQVVVGRERSVPFFIHPEVWRRTLPKAFGFYPQQRCGIAVPNRHPACHLDDARIRGGGRRLDVTGGWHDAGDTRKWMQTALHSGYCMTQMARHLGADWNSDGKGLAPVLEELRWGNRYWLKMQDSDGRVWSDTAGGVNGDDSDNHWTDNLSNTVDDRFVNPNKPGAVQALFVATQSRLFKMFQEEDPSYAQTCLAAGLTCWQASRRGNDIPEIAWWLLAALGLHEATRQDEWKQEAVKLAGRLLERQNQVFLAGQKAVRGFWLTASRSVLNGFWPTEDEQAIGSQPGRDLFPFASSWMSAIPALAILELVRYFPDHPETSRWRDAVKMYLEDYIRPLVGKSAYQIIPYAVFLDSPTAEKYRPLAGDMTYRFFMPVRREFFWQGLTSHLQSHAVLLAIAAKAFNNEEYRELAYRQMEWIMGANPFGACLMTGEGLRNPYPHSRFTGLVVGGIMNGIAGNVQDEPVLDVEVGIDWRTTEYWCPHNGWYLWAVSELSTDVRSNRA